MKKMLSKKKGFTLVELLVVVAIIAILMLIALPKFMDSTKGAKLKTFEGNFRTLISSSQQYIANNNGSYTDIEKSTSDVKKLGDSMKDKPKGATYTVQANNIVAELSASEIDSGSTAYKITYSLADTSITVNSKPTGIKSTFDSTSSTSSTSVP